MQGAPFDIILARLRCLPVIATIGNPLDDVGNHLKRIAHATNRWRWFLP